MAKQAPLRELAQVVRYPTSYIDLGGNYTTKADARYLKALSWATSEAIPPTASFLALHPSITESLIQWYSGKGGIVAIIGGDNFGTMAATSALLGRSVLSAPLSDEIAKMINEHIDLLTLPIYCNTNALEQANEGLDLVIGVIDDDTTPFNIEQIQQAFKILNNNRFGVLIWALKDKDYNEVNALKAVLNMWLSSHHISISDEIVISEKLLPSYEVSQAFKSNRRLDRLHYTCQVFIKGNKGDAIEACGYLSYYNESEVTYG